VAAWGDQEFLIATTIAIAGFFAVLAWNAPFPDRRDTFVLGPLPVHARTIFIAKIAAVVTALGISVIAINSFTGLFYPFVVIPPQGNALRSFGAYWITMIGAGLFVLCTMPAVEGIAALALSYRLFLRLSSFLQLAAFFLILAIYFLIPALANEAGLKSTSHQRLVEWPPSFSFLALFQELNGEANPVFAPLAKRAVWALLLAASVACFVYPLAYYRVLRRTIEEPDIAPSDRSRPAKRKGCPVALRANWIFRITAVDLAQYFAAVRKSLFVLTAVPIWVLSAILYFSIWPGRPALEHMFVLVATGIVLVESALLEFRKIPFACSYLPGKAKLKLKVGVYGILFLFCADLGVGFEFWAMQKFIRFAALSVILLAAAIYAYRHQAQLAMAPENRIQFEDLPPADVLALDLHQS
jgi:hypothetical protein